MSVATSQLHLIMLKEMSFDLSYRLRLAEDLFCEAATAVMAANTFDDFTWKQQASQKVHDYAQTLFVIHDDLIRIHDTQPIIFPREPAEWVWEQPQPTAILTAFLERMQAVAEAMDAILCKRLDALTKEEQP